MLVWLTSGDSGPHRGPDGYLVHLTGQNVRSVHRSFESIASSRIGSHHANDHCASVSNAYCSISSATRLSNVCNLSSTAYSPDRPGLPQNIASFRYGDHV